MSSSDAPSRAPLRPARPVLLGPPRSSSRPRLLCLPLDFPRKAAANCATSPGFGGVAFVEIGRQRLFHGQAAQRLSTRAAACRSILGVSQPHRQRENRGCVNFLAALREVSASRARFSRAHRGLALDSQITGVSLFLQFPQAERFHQPAAFPGKRRWLSVVFVHWATGVRAQVRTPPAVR